MTNLLGGIFKKQEPRPPEPSAFTHTQLVDAWKAIANSKLITVENTTAYVLLRSLCKTQFQTELVDPADLNMLVDNATKHLRAAFMPIRNAIKLANGRYPYDVLLNAVIGFTYYVNDKHLPVSLTSIGKTNLSKFAKMVHANILAEVAR